MQSGGAGVEIPVVDPKDKMLPKGGGARTIATLLHTDSNSSDVAAAAAVAATSSAAAAGGPGGSPLGGSLPNATATSRVKLPPMAEGIRLATVKLPTLTSKPSGQPSQQFSQQSSP